MVFKTNIVGALLLLFLAQACHAELMCYVCNNCPKIMPDTPQLPCNADYFNTGGTTLPATMTTTTPHTTEAEATTTTPLEADKSSTTVGAVSSTEAATSEATTTTPETTADTTTAVTTESPTPTPPTPPTIGPPQTTTHLPTPPNPGTAVVPNDVVFNELTVNTTSSANNTATPKTYVESAALRLRQLRSTATSTTASTSANVTYHCYRIQKNVNGTMVTDRGCSAVTTMQAVCPTLQEANIGTPVNKCIPCSKSLCNGSGALTVAISTLIMGLLAALLTRH